MKEKFKILTDREHILQRAGMYIGSISSEESYRFINGKVSNIRYVPGLIKITNELIDNSIDEHLRSGFKNANLIKIEMTEKSFSIIDNGRGIPVELYQGEMRPKLAWCTAKAGTSFEENRIGPGANGVGSVCANVFSKIFIGETCDSKNYCKVLSSDNMSNIAVTDRKMKAQDVQGTRVYIEPDFKKFSVDGYTDDDIMLIKERINILSATYPKIKFIFNNEIIKFKKQSEYLETFGSKYIDCNFQNGFFAIFPSGDDEYHQRTSIDGLEFVSGGTHEIIISREIAYSLREMIKKKYKLEMMPAEIKRGIMLVMIGSSFPNMKFNSQTKEQLTNPENETKKWLGEIDFQRISKKILLTDEIIQPIIANKLAKQQAAEARAITLEQKKMSKKYVEKHLPAKSKNVSETILLLCEGDSAAGQGIKVRDINRHGFFPMRGCVKNVYGLKDKDIIDNKELNNIMTILGLKFNMSENDIRYNLNYGKIGILTDADNDGGHIATLLINFLYRWKELFAQQKVYIVTSPRYIFTKNKGKKNEEHFYCYTYEEYEKVREKYKNWELRYIKGLGSLRPHEFKDVLNNEDRWLCVEIDDPKCFDIMFSSNVEERRKIMGI